MAERFAFTVTYVEAELRSAVRQYLIRSLFENSWMSFLASFAVVIGIGMLLFARRLDFVTGVCTGLLLALLAMIGMLALGAFRRMRTSLAAMKVPTAEFRLGDDGFAVETDSASASYRWAMVGQIWKLDRVWLLLFSAAHFMTLPLAGVPAEALAFIESKVTPRRF